MKFTLAISPDGFSSKSYYVQKTVLYPSGMILGSVRKDAFEFDTEAEAQKFLEGEVTVKMSKSVVKRLKIMKG